MKTKISIKQAVLVSLIVFSIVVAGLFVNKNAEIKHKLADQKLKSEMLLSEKLNLDKSIVKLDKDVGESSDKNIHLNKKFVEINASILAKNNEIEILKAQNASIKTLQKKNEELDILTQKLNTEINGLNNSLANANAENNKLANQLTAYSNSNSGLSADNAILKAMISENYRTEALHGKKERLTVNARRTNKLSVSFDLPGSTANNKIYFKVIKPNGQEISSNDDLASTTIRIEENGDGFVASSDANTIGSSGTKRVEMTYKANEKLKNGIYQFNIYNDDRFIGSTQLRLK